MSELILQLTKQLDGGMVLRCVREDGSVTWQKQQGRQAAFFPMHDLTHYAVESELGFRAGFYGLIADGWDIADTEGKSERGPLPDEAILVEKVVGSFDAERAGGTVWSTRDFNTQLADFSTMKGLPPPRVLSEDELSRVRVRIRELFNQWVKLDPGATLELTFSRYR